ncbi:ATPase, T2SS/T4P/T4SS family [Gleimia sp. 6138-11-ORH1]|uniref:CpaF family protein n=1 Tax=Gleimia sp. 6138-11-ORH1 TaxID=2973937 RepID=UPI002169FE02|nr:ATPase, T2SS/T4P/T4SS family [Gleimia sp. 6138-11-ORH1]MCS4484736.1 ATPase, T2SS/T4P/T4SS family [Gleimia sp. 6138-11-ORH1]
MLLNSSSRTALSEGNSAGYALNMGESIFSSRQHLEQNLVELEALLAGPGSQIAALLEDPQITDVLINGQTLFIEKAGALRELPPLDLTISQVRELAVRLAAVAGTRLDEAKPIADGTLPDGTRLNAVISPLAPQSVLISLRTKRSLSFSLEQLHFQGSLPNPAYKLVKQLIEARASTLISGATGSGKTTLLAAILSEICPQQRIIVIEEVPELNPNHPHVVTLLAKQANVQGQGEVTLSQLVQTSLRMRPDRIVLGECRGAEIRDLLAALNTGHQGSWGTIHANSALDVPARLEALGTLANLSSASIAAQTVAGLDAFIHVNRVKNLRQVTQIALPTRTQQGDLTATLVWDSQAGLVNPSAWEELLARLNPSGVKL